MPATSKLSTEGCQGNDFFAKILPGTSLKNLSQGIVKHMIIKILKGLSMPKAYHTSDPVCRPLQINSYHSSKW